MALKKKRARPRLYTVNLTEETKRRAKIAAERKGVFLRDYVEAATIAAIEKDNADANA